MPGDEEDYYKDMAISVTPAIESAYKIDSSSWITYATYTGFSPEILKTTPGFIKYVPDYAICQWTVTEMMRNQEEVGGGFFNRKYFSWEDGFMPPTRNNVALIHQGDMWFAGVEVGCIVNIIQEFCYKSAKAGIDGLVWFGESSDEVTPAFLNYTAFEYFSKNPNASMEDFAKDKLVDIAGGEEYALKFINILNRKERTINVCNRDFDEVYGIWREVSINDKKSPKYAYETIKLWEWLFHITFQRKCVVTSINLTS
jgi:hypothetical protein